MAQTIIQSEKYAPEKSWYHIDMKTIKTLKVNGIKAEDAINAGRAYISSHAMPSADTKILNDLCIVAKGLADRLGLNSKNSSNPPSSDQNKPLPKPKNPKKPIGGQQGHVGSNLPQYDNPDECVVLALSELELPKGEYQDAGFIKRQVVDIRTTRHIIEYQAQVLIDQSGKKWIAEFPDGVSAPVQYSNKVKAYTVYHSVSQLIPYKRLCQQMQNLFDIPIAEGTIYRHLLQATQYLKQFVALAKLMLIQSAYIHTDETGINIIGGKHWIHTLSNTKWYLQDFHKKRGYEAVQAMQVLECFSGVLCHDHWKTYYKLQQCSHALCNAHHERELTRAHDQDHQQWADQMLQLLSNTNIRTQEAGGLLPAPVQQTVRIQYREILAQAKLECPELLSKKPNSKKRPAQTKARNLLERLAEYEDDTLRFMTDINIGYTNNEAERSIRMTKVKEKISGVYRSHDGAHAYCAVRSYILTCEAHGLEAYSALQLLMNKQWPDFIQKLFDYYGGTEKIQTYYQLITQDGISALDAIPKPPPE